MEDKIPEIAFDKLKIINKGLPVSITKVTNNIATVEFFEGEEGIHKIIEINVDRLSFV